MIKCVLTAIVFWNFAARAQRTVTATRTVMINALNPVPAPGGVGSVLAGASSAQQGISAIGNMPVCVTQTCPNITMRYEVPGFVIVDRFLLAAQLLDNISALQADYEFWYASSPTAPILSYITGQLATLQGYVDDLQYNCVPVSFRIYSATVNADILLHDPVASPAGLLLAGPGGNVTLNDIPGGALAADPVKATIMIYKK